MKAVNFIKHMGLFGNRPDIRIVKRMGVVKEYKTVGRDDLAEVEKYCKDNKFTLITFTVKDNTLIVDVV